MHQCDCGPPSRSVRRIQIVTDFYNEIFINFNRVIEDTLWTHDFDFAARFSISEKSSSTTS